MQLSKSMSMYDSRFHQKLIKHLMEDYRKAVLVGEGSNIHSVEPQVAAKFRGDFYGLLNELSVSNKYHYFIMRLNNLKSPQDYDGLSINIIIPNIGIIERAVNIFFTIKK